MLSDKLLLLLSLTPLGWTKRPKGHTAPNAPSLTERTGGFVHTIKVGENGNFFDPNEVIANVGDIVDFRFYPRNHSVARAAYGSPCMPYEFGRLAMEGFWSGYMPINVPSPNPPQYQIVINDTEPVFFYCTHNDSCLGFQMVGVINPNATQTLESQIEFARHASQKMAPDELLDSETIRKPKSTPTPSLVPQHHHPVLSAGVAGITLGGLCILLIAAALFYLFTSRRAAHQQLQKANLSLPPSYTNRHQTYLNSAHIPSKDTEYQGVHHRGGEYGYPAEADCSFIGSPIAYGSGMALGMSEVEGDSGFPYTGQGSDQI